jgi:hypothetical protein
MGEKLDPERFWDDVEQDLRSGPPSRVASLCRCKFDGAGSYQ